MHSRMMDKYMNKMVFASGWKIMTNSLRLSLKTSISMMWQILTKFGLSNRSTWLKTKEYLLQGDLLYAITIGCILMLRISCFFSTLSKQRQGSSKASKFTCQISESKNLSSKNSMALKAFGETNKSKKSSKLVKKNRKNQ